MKHLHRMAQLPSLPVSSPELAMSVGLGSLSPAAGRGQQEATEMQDGPKSLLSGQSSVMQGCDGKRYPLTSGVSKSTVGAWPVSQLVRSVCLFVCKSSLQRSDGQPGRCGG